MHPEAFAFVQKNIPARPGFVLEIGSRNINGSVRQLFAAAVSYVGLDLVDGDGVDVVADASTWQTSRTFNTIVCCEVLEHTDVWREIIAKCGELLDAGGSLILTCAGPGRKPHGAHGGPVGSEFYENISVEMLEAETSKWGDGVICQAGDDTQALIVKRA